MSEEQKVTSNKVKLPSKTVTAVALIIILGIIDAFGILFGSFIGNLEGGGFVISYLASCICVLKFLSAILICMKNRIAWILAIVILSGILIYLLAGILPAIISELKITFAEPKIAVVTIEAILYYLVILILPFIPFVLIILDRKKYFEMLRQRETLK